MSASEKFTILPLSFPTDAREILRINYRFVFLSQPIPGLSKNQEILIYCQTGIQISHNINAYLEFCKNASNPITEEEFIATGLDGSLMVAKLSAPGNLGWKLVQSSNPSSIISWVMFCPPQPLDERSDKEQIRDLRKEIDGSKSSRSKESMFKMRMEYRVLNERFLGKGYVSRFWELWGLATDEEWQRRGFASRLVEWGMGKLEALVRESEGVGVYVTASLVGQRTYEKAGFEMIGKNGGGTDVLEKLSHVWFIKRFD